MQKLDAILANANKEFRKADESTKKTLIGIFGEDAFNRKITDLVQSYEDACGLKGILPLVQDQFNFLPENQREYYFFHHQIVTITEALNEFRVPNYYDDGEKKYELWFCLDSPAAGGPGFSCRDSYCDRSLSYVGARLVFFDLDVAKYAAKQFLDKYEVIISSKGMKVEPVFTETYN